VWESAALEKRTCGEFLDAARFTRNGSQKLLECKLQGFKVSECQNSRSLGPYFETQSSLLADTELANDRLITLGIVFLEVVEQAAPLADQHEKSAARAVVFLVRLEVLRQLADALAEQGDLDFRTSGIAGMRAVSVNEGFLLLSG
jgi:hypothetical protein